VLGIEFAGFQLALLSAVIEFEFDKAMIGLPVAAQFFSASFMPLVFGPISDRIGKMKIIASFMIVFSFGCFLAGVSGSPILFLIGVFIIGIGFSVCECSIAAAVSDIFFETREKYFNFIQSFFCIGAVLSPLALQALMDTYSASWRVIFIICALGMIAVLPVLLLSRINPVSKSGHIEHAEHLDHIPEENKQSNPLLIFGFVLCVFIYVGVEGCLSFFADTVLTLGLNAPDFGAFAISIFWATMGIGRFVFGRIKKIPRKSTPISLLCMAVIIACFVFVEQGYTILVMFGLAGFACSGVWPGIVNAAVAVNRNASGTTLSYLNLGAGLGGTFLPLFIGALLTGSGLNVSFLVMSVFPVLAGIFMLKNSREDNAPDPK
jgi:FHS family glucose/mannose:H+ symporter-like MFS transporter